MKKLVLMFAALALASPVYAQGDCHVRDIVQIEAFPVTTRYICESKDVTWTLSLLVGDNAQLEVNYNGPLGNASWFQPVQVSGKTISYHGCLDGGLECWTSTRPTR